MGIAKLWSEKEEQFLVDNYKNLSDKKLAKELKRTTESISNKRLRLGLIRCSLDKNLPNLLPKDGVKFVMNKYGLGYWEAKEEYRQWRENYLKFPKGE